MHFLDAQVIIGKSIFFWGSVDYYSVGTIIIICCQPIFIPLKHTNNIKKSVSTSKKTQSVYIKRSADEFC